MEIITMLTNLLTDPWFYGIGIAIILFAWGVIRGPLRKLPLIGKLKKNQYLIILGIGLLVTSGLLGGVLVSTETGSLNTIPLSIEDTTPFTLNAQTFELEDNEIVLRLTEADLVADATIDAGILELSRMTGIDTTQSFPLSATVPLQFEDAIMPNGVYYNLVSRTTDGVSKVFFSTDGTAADSSDSQMTKQVIFAEGSAVAEVSFLIELDATAFGHMDQYDEKSIVLNVAGQSVTVTIVKMDN